MCYVFQAIVYFNICADEKLCKFQNLMTVAAYLLVTILHCEFVLVFLTNKLCGVDVD